MDPKTKLAAGRRKASAMAPYFTAALYHLIYWPAPGLGTFAVTDKSVLLWDPAIVEKWSIPEIGAVLVHEACHVLRRHLKRAESAGIAPNERQIWNIAADCTINCTIPGLPLPADGVLPKQFGLDDGWTAEQYYAHLRANAVEIEIQACGSGAGNPHPDEGKHGQGMEAEGVEGRSTEEQQAMRQQVAAAIQKQVEEKGRGTIPSDWLVWADQMLSPPKILWQDKLARFTKNAITWTRGAVDYRYDRPSRRQAIYGYGPQSPILPAMRAPVPEIMLGVDTSGSMGPSDLQEAMSEAQGIIQSIGARLTFAAFDAAVSGIRQVETVAAACKMLKGGGGTDFEPLMRAAEQCRPRPDVLIIATDGWAPAPNPPSKMKVVWLLVGAGATQPADWGDVVWTHEEAEHQQQEAA